ncbi:hypothetical protein TpMuguga_01g00748 [Theileria parva strain Muguga]|uniref:Uncharacterized protein n=1 Tax=Theileria parva TaxID=5875 RepID=Q4N7S2_THEPA|nr:uncharacterized protein TpMuguga_01g00748 [Theileria parva strain Muguga]EAN33986.1 hypothetical protein TpMuguga_01g00748 [Theileria parva strain Muguga]|eukprot:XP_766269.1 hypothetical protein [Theileria parva strain Muguga]
MEDNSYFEELCTQVYNYYGKARNVDPNKHALVMLRSMGEFWTEDEVKNALLNLNDRQEFLSFTNFRRLAKSKWYDPNNNENEEGEQVNDDGYGNQIHMLSEDIQKFKNAFNRVSKFYTGNEGENKTLPVNVLYNILTNFDNPMPKRVGTYLVSSLNVYNNEVSARSLLCLIAKREEFGKVL